MDFTDPNPPDLARSFLFIDLNKSPSPAAESLPSSSACLSPTLLVRSFHDNPAPPRGLPAEIPGEGRLGFCGSCGLAEIRGQVVVCDGCEKGFHFVCAGMTAAQAAAVEEWVCRECKSAAVGSRRWPLGIKRAGGAGGFRLLDINAPPPSDVDGAGNGDEGLEMLGVRGSRCEPSPFCSFTSAASHTGGSSDNLPIQYEDFFLLSVGDIDARPSYHDAGHVWPVGYRSCWHDKITGSLFLCNVVDGGDAGPLFKIRRTSCSSMPIPYGSSVLCRKTLGTQDREDTEENNSLNCLNPVYEDENTVDVVLSDPSLPLDDDVVSWLRSSSHGADFQKVNSLQKETNSSIKGSQHILSTSLFVGDKIDEFSIDGRSSSAVWAILSQKLVDACRLIYNRTGSLRFFCKHAEDGVSSLCYNDEVNKNKVTFSCLDKFCSLLGTINIPCVVRSDQEFELASNVLKDWMSIDRFGLDADFVQEVIEQLPAASCCSQYRSLKSRDGYSVAPLVGNGLLVVNAKITARERDTAPNISEGARQRVKTRMDVDSLSASRPLPSGKHLGSKLPPQVVGDVLQAWEFLSRFHERLGLERALPLDELEEELISPWCESLCPSEQSGKNLSDDHVKACNPSREASVQTSSSSGEADTCKESAIFIEMETAAVRQEAQARVASSTFGRCTGLILRKVHIALLNVLLFELLLKVATVLDPTLDGVESKPRRGRKKDVDNSTLAKRSKLSMLPINELTWPDLARRYILSMVCMDGGSDPETIGRESSKIFRCLQGDGGSLCGSLSGIAGMEADALLLAEARKRIYGPLSLSDRVISIEDVEVEAVPVPVNEETNGISTPDWAQELEPARKLPTNVGTRIRKCVYAALEKNPPNWAREILEHSISKEVYKGNASGPTKKAVISVLAKVTGAPVPQKPPKEKKKKNLISVPDIMMRQCRIVLSRTAFVDDDKVLCNLIGRSLRSSSDNDEEGLIGCPGVVSRPLDFRTIDLRLKLGSYGGSHEAFREDAHELWNNLRTVYADQPERVKLVETLSEKFESLYEQEVIPLSEKLNNYVEMERIDPEAKKELADIVTSTSNIPKAPWDDGVCKVCGIDKDDDSVLLCDKCDAEYHTYCLSPPLARIPDGNWYCPSCAPGGSNAPKSATFSQRRGRRYRSDVIRRYLDELASLAAMMEETEYWDFNVHERTMLLKFLCDELLNSSQIRPHIEHCIETYLDLQQKLRSLSSEIKILKVREDILLSRAGAAKNSSSIGIQAVASNLLETTKPHDSQSLPNTNNMGKISITNPKPSNSENQPEDMDVITSDEPELNGNHTSTERVRKRHKSIGEPDSVSNSSQEVNGTVNEASVQVSRVLEATESDVSGLPLSGSGSGQIAEFACPSTSIDPQAFNIDSIRKEISQIQESIADVETRLLENSIRMEFLGNDSAGRLYWLSAKPFEYPSVIVDGTITLQKEERADGRLLVGNASTSHDLNPPKTEGSNASCPFSHEAGSSSMACSQWMSYQSDSEVKSLIQWLRDDDPKERELKESIQHWQKLRSFVPLQDEKTKQAESVAWQTSNGKSDSSNHIVTKASAILEKTYGTCFEVNMNDNFKRQWKKARLTGDQKMYRCKCLEPIWVSRHHCLRCHKTFLTASDFDKHNDGHCSSRSVVPAKRKETSEPPGSRSKSEPHIVGASKSAGVVLSSGLIKFQNEGLTCPHRFEEISSKFVTNDSIKDLVKGVGLLGSDGRPSFVRSISSHLSAPELAFSPSHKDANHSTSSEMEVSSQAVDPRPKVHSGTVSANSLGMSSSDRVSANLKADRSLPGTHVRERRAPSNRRGLSLEASHCCVVREASLRPLVGRAAEILRHLKISLLDMEAALPEEALSPSRALIEKRLAWRAFVKNAETIFELVQATFVLEDMIRAEYLRNEWYYWSSLSAAARVSTLSALALRIHALDNVIIYEKAASVPSPPDNLKPSSDAEQPPPPIPNSDSAEKPRSGRRVSKKRKEKEMEG